MELENGLGSSLMPDVYPAHKKKIEAQYGSIFYSAKISTMIIWGLEGLILFSEKIMFVESIKKSLILGKNSIVETI